MRRLQRHCTALAGLALLAGPSLAGEIEAPYMDLLSSGQGYNTFLGEGAMHNAVEITGLSRRDEPAGADKTGNPHQPLNFTGPSPYVPGSMDNDQIGPSPLDKIHEENERWNADDDQAAARVSKREVQEGWVACPGGQSSGRIRKSSRQLKTYESYLKSLDVSASATISGYGQSASLSGSYLDQAEFVASDLTFLIVLEVKKQQSTAVPKYSFQRKFYEKETFHEKFGNRFIRGFQAGGKLIARVSVYAKEKSAQSDIATSAEVAANALAASGSFSSEAKSSIAQLKKQAKVKIDVFYEGDLGRDVQGSHKADSEANSVDSAFDEAKSWATSFQDRACQHDFKYKALLEEYRKIGDFPSNEVKAMEYGSASGEAFGVLKELVMISEMAQFLRRDPDMPEEVATDIRRLEEDLVQASKDWVKATAKDPSRARETADDLQRRFVADFWQTKTPVEKLSKAYYEAKLRKGYAVELENPEVPTLLELVKMLNRPKKNGKGNVFTFPRLPKTKPKTKPKPEAPKPAPNAPEPKPQDAGPDKSRYGKKAKATGRRAGRWCELDNKDAYNMVDKEYYLQEKGTTQKGDEPQDLEKCAKNEQPRYGKKAKATGDWARDWCRLDNGDSYNLKTREYYDVQQVTWHAGDEPEGIAECAKTAAARYDKAGTATGAWENGWCKLDNGDAYSPETGEYEVRPKGSAADGSDDAAQSVSLQLGDAPQKLRDCLDNAHGGAAGEANGTGEANGAGDASAKGCDSMDLTLRVPVATAFGQTVKVVGGSAALGGWDPAQAVALDSSEYRHPDSPTWKGRVSVKPGERLEYKYVRVERDGAVAWEKGGNRVYEAPKTCEAAPEPRADSAPDFP